MNEEWRDIPGFSGYRASNFGRVRGPRRLLTPGCNLKGYLHVSATKPKRTVSVHKLVLLAFVGERPEGCEVNHKDGVKSNNRLDNLEYATSAENNHHAMTTGLRNLKVSRDDIAEMAELAKTISMRQIGTRYGIHHSYVGFLLRGKRKVAV